MHVGKKRFTFQVWDFIGKIPSKIQEEQGHAMGSLLTVVKSNIITTLFA